MHARVSVINYYEGKVLVVSYYPFCKDQGPDFLSYLSVTKIIKLFCYASDYVVTSLVMTV